MSITLTCLVCYSLISTVIIPLSVPSNITVELNTSEYTNIDTTTGTYVYPVIEGTQPIARRLISKDRYCCPNKSSAGTHHLISSPSFSEEVSTLSSIPYWDWRSALFEGVSGDWTTSVKDQGSIGSCWAFAILGALETIINIQEANPDYDLDLSEQYLVSCFAGTTSGSLVHGALNFMHNKGGALLEHCFPYAADATLSCTAKCDDWVQHLIPISEYAHLEYENLADIQEHVATIGPIIGSFSVYEDFLNHTEGVYRYRDGNKLGGHCVVIIGFDNEQNCWICKNSWGDTWGEAGYFCIGFGECAIEDNMYVVGYRPNHYNRQPLKPAVPSGTVTGNITTLYYYETIAVDPDGDSLFYQYDWGDGNVSDWLGPIMANSTASAYHQWRMQGRYQIRTRCCDVFGSISSWSDPLIISVPIDLSTNSFWCRLHSLLTSLLGGRGFMPHY